MNKITTENLDKVRQAVNICTMCGFCKSVCPSFKAVRWDSSVARGRVILSYGLLTGDIPADGSVIENIYTCTTCMDCVRRCPSKVNVVEIVELCRADLVKNGHILPKHKAAAENILEHGNPFGEKESAVRRLKVKPKNAEIGYFPGCAATFRSPETTKAALSVFRKLNVDHTVVDCKCCGSVMQRIGWDNSDVVKMMENNVAAIRKQNVETLIVSCAGCYRMFKEEYPKFTETPFKVLHISEFLASQNLKMKPMRISATYHDPCHLGRHANVYDAPREIIKRIPEITFNEMTNSRDTGRCCGGGGGVRSAYPDESKAMAEARLTEAAFADMIITSCPFCVNNLTFGMGEKKTRVADLIELADELL
ncbi:MAG: heterodisulfide reductase-related iron-sulfur binding cluster [Methanomassiliicoccaceae archaeon]|nr:heterodisulfide reductase-related iron-sulfur binding cluster [Methanomassiliicoccaceae archaeon]